MDGAELPAAYALDLVTLAERFGVEPTAILAGLDVTMERLKDPATRLPFALCEELVLRAQRLSKEPALALHMGLHMRLSSHGFLGFAAMTACNVREALELAARFSRTRTDVVGISLHVEGEKASLVLEDRMPKGSLREFLVIALLIGIARLGYVVTGRELPGYADCTLTEPDYFAKVARAFSGEVRFSQPFNRLVFAAAVLDLPVAGADPVAFQLAREQCERELAQRGDATDFVGSVRSAIARPGDGCPSASEVAHRLHVSTRTLKRKLAANGTTFSAVLDDLRRQKALLLLEHPELSLQQIAERLGYSDLANFTRAFRRWTGRTPAALRDAKRVRL